MTISKWHEFKNYEDLKHQVEELHQQKQQLQEGEWNDQKHIAFNKLDILYQKLRPQLEELKPISQFVEGGAKKLNGPGLRLRIREIDQQGWIALCKIEAIQELELIHFNLDLARINQLPYLSKVTLNSYPINDPELKLLMDLKAPKVGLSYAEAFNHFTFHDPLKNKQVFFTWCNQLQGVSIHHQLLSNLSMGTCINCSSLEIWAPPPKPKSLFSKEDDSHIIELPQNAVTALDFVETLTTLHLCNLRLDRLPTLPSFITQLAFHHCIGGETFVLDKNVNQVLLDQCRLSSATVIPRGVKKLEITGPVSDQNFPKISDNLAWLTITNGQITDTTIKKLPEDLKRLTLEKCQKVRMTVAQAALVFNNCEFKGFPGGDSPSVQLRGQLEKEILGQPQAISAALKMIHVAKAGTLIPKRPAATLFIIGRLGSGKKTLAELIASLSGRKLRRYESKNLDKTELCNDVQKTPDAILLFNHIEKAPKIFYSSLLSIMREGKLIDKEGNDIDFSKSFIIATCQMGSERIGTLDWRAPKASMEKATAIAQSVIIKYLGTNFEDRFDHIVPFKPLSQDNIEAIVKKKLKEYAEVKFNETGIRLEIDKKVWEGAIKDIVNGSAATDLLLNKLKSLINQKLSAAINDKAIQKGQTAHIRGELGKGIALKLKLENK